MLETPSLELYCGKSFGQRGLWFGADCLEKRGGIPPRVSALTITEQTEDDLYRETKPLFHMRNEQVQKLLDEIWQLGYRPSDGECSIGQIGAIKDHLADMRKIVGSKLKVEL